MVHVQPFVAIILGYGSQQDAEQLARAAGATAILRPGQPHPTPLHTPDAVIDLAGDHQPDDGRDRADAVIDLAPAGPGAEAAPGDVIDLVEPRESEQPSPLFLPDAAVVIDPAEVTEVTALVTAVHVVLGHLARVTPACVVTARSAIGSGELVAGPFAVLSAVADEQFAEPFAEPAAGPGSSAALRPWIEALIRRGVELQTVAI